MNPGPEFADKAHRYFSAACFNRAWDLIEKQTRTPEEDEQMIQLNQASLWHWGQRPDCTRRNRSVGYWQAARIYTLLGQADHARHYAQLALDYAQGEGAFYVAYGFEALARAEVAAGRRAPALASLAEARRLAEDVTDAEEKQALVADLDQIARMLD